MLSKLILLNSAKFSKAILDFGQDLKTVQLVGGNRFGKTSLLNSINFLFVPDSRQLTKLFGDHTLQQTLNYYFPRENESFILYQIYKNGFFTILVKTDNGKLSYYKYNQEYKDEHYFDENNRLLKFKEIQSNFLNNGIELEHISNSQEYLNFAYSREKRKNNCVVWLEKTVKQKGLNNPFTEMYKCLVQPKLINNDSLKEALISADNRKENYDLEFSKGKEGDLLTLQRYLDEVRKIREISDEFILFKKLVNDYNTKQIIIDELFFVFSTLYETEITQIDLRIKDYELQVQLSENKVKLTLRPNERQLSEQKGKKRGEIETSEKEQRKLENQLKEIEQLEPLQFLEQQLENLEKQRTDKEFELQKIKKENATELSVQQEIKKLDKELININNDIEGNSDKLIQHISSDEKTRKLLNRILTDDIKRLPKSAVLKQITEINQKLNIGDGTIEISNISPLAFETIEELKTKVEVLKSKIQNLKITLQVIQDREKFEKELEITKNSIKETTKKIELLAKETVVRTELENVLKLIKNIKIQFQEIENEIDKINDQITTEINNSESYKSKLTENITRRKKLIEDYENIKLKQIFPKSNQSDRTDIDVIIKELNNYINEIERLKERKNEKLNDLKRRSDKHTTEEIFIQEIEEEITTVQQKEDSINGLLQSIADQFSNPADRLLKGFQEFQESFIRPFNTQLSKIRISDIEEIKLIIKPTVELIKDIETLREIRELRPNDLFYQSTNNKDGLALLKDWLTREKKVFFEELFSIEAQILVEGKTRKIDFSKEIESGGTNRMLKFIIFLSIIKKLVVNSIDNRIPFCIDETLMIDTQNQEEMIRFCNENHFLPIFAAPDPVKSNIDRFYYLMPSAKGDKMFVINRKQK